jgi:subtilisin family serine protease
MQRALDYALARNVVVVAAAGNDQAAQLTWPAADPRVVSVGAVDALQQQVTFSNSGPQLQITAPGYGVQTAWTDGTRVWLDGTSASAPIVAGAIAAMMSQNPGMTAGQAWSVLREHVAEAGPAGPDADFGQGVIDLGWAMARDDFARIDTAVASHHYDAASGAMQFVVQNRSATTMAGLRMVIEVDGVRSEALLEPVPPGGTTTVTVPVTADQLQGPAPVSFTTRLVNPPGVVDAVPANNLRSSSVGGRLPAGGEAGGSDG